MTNEEIDIFINKISKEFGEQFSSAMKMQTLEGYKNSVLTLIPTTLLVCSKMLGEIAKRLPEKKE